MFTKTILAKTVLLAALCLTVLTGLAPKAQAGVLWAGLGAPIGYTPYPFGVYGGATLVYNPYWYYFYGVPYYGFARDYTYFYAPTPFFGAPWVWGFWDPPDLGNVHALIEYDEIFTGLDSSGHAIGLNGIQVTSSTVIGNVDGTLYPGQVIQTTFAALLSLAHPTNSSNILQLLGDAIQNTPNAPVTLVRYMDVPIIQIAQEAPEPATLSMLGLGLALIVTGRVRRSLRRSP